MRSCRLAALVVALAAGPLQAQPTTGAPASPVARGVTYASHLEPAESPRGQAQRLIVALASARATCDGDLMETLLTEDVHYAYPSATLIGIDQVLEDLEVTCGPSARARPSEVSYYLPRDAFYIDLESSRVAVELQRREVRQGAEVVENGVWVVATREGRIAVIKDYTDERVGDLQVQGVLDYDHDAEVLTPWPPRTTDWATCYPVVRATALNDCEPE